MSKKRKLGSSAPPREVSGVGEARATQRKKVANDQLWEDFRAARPDANLQKEWEELPEEVLRNPKLYEKFAGFLVTTIIPPGRKNGGNNYKPGTVTRVVGAALTRFCRKFANSTDPKTRDFVHGLNNPISLIYKWAARMKRNMERDLQERAVDKGEDLSERPPDIYRSHVESMRRALALEDCDDSTERGFAILIGWISSGRAHECSLVSLSGASL